jgi:hypothetical protein
MKHPFILIFALFFLATGSAEAATSKTKYRHALSAVMIFQNEADYLDEWIQYHEMLGVEHFYLYNNLSDDNYREVLQPHIERGVVELIEWPYAHSENISWVSVQLKCYRDAVARAKKQTEWLAIIDSDEFIVPARHDTITAMLEDLEKSDRKGDIAGYQIQWVVFGTSGVETVPKGRLMIELLTKHEVEPHKYRKSIVKPAYVKDFGDPHKASFKKHKKNRPLDIGIAQINHYMFRDLSYFNNVKIPRVQKRFNSVDTLLESERNANSSDSFNAIRRFIPALRQKMGL